MPGIATPQASFPPYFRLFTGIYGVIAALELLSNLLFEQMPLLHYLAKPLIMISLSAYYFYQTMHRHDRTHYLMQGALLFALMGDIFLMFGGELYFQLGLGSFLLAQLCYIAVFARTRTAASSRGLLLRKPWILVPLLVYVLALLGLLQDALGPFLVPVLLYSLALATMVVMALNRWRRVGYNSFSFVFLGALLFLISDSMIAVDRFGQALLPIPWAQIWIMLTYIVAQYLIVMGILFELQQRRP